MLCRSTARSPRRLGQGLPDRPAVSNTGSAQPTRSARVSGSPRRYTFPETTPITPGLSTSGTQPAPLPILLPAGNRQACHHRKAITPTQYRLIVGRVRGREAMVAGRRALMRQAQPARPASRHAAGHRSKIHTPLPWDGLSRYRRADSAGISPQGRAWRGSRMPCHPPVLRHLPAV